MISESCDGTLTDEFLAKMTSRLRDRTGADLAFAASVHPRTKQLTVRCADGVRTDACLGTTIAPGEGVGGRVVALGRHVVSGYARSAGGNADGTLRRGCREQIRSLLAMPLRLDGRVLFVLYVAGRADKPITSATTDLALSFVRHVESFVAQSAKSYQMDAPRRWNVDERALRRIDSELVQLSMEIVATPARARIAAIRNLLEDSVLEQAATEGTTYTLTRRELDVLGLVAEGLSNVEAAERLVVSPETVKAYLRNIRSKLGVRNRTAAVNVARRSGLLQ